MDKAQIYKEWIKVQELTLTASAEIIIKNMNRLTTGNVAHHRISTKKQAEMIKALCEEIHPILKNWVTELVKNNI